MCVGWVSGLISAVKIPLLFTAQLFQIKEGHLSSLINKNFQYPPQWLGCNSSAVCCTLQNVNLIWTEMHISYVIILWKMSSNSWQTECLSLSLIMIPQQKSIWSKVLSSRHPLRTVDEHSPLRPRLSSRSRLLYCYNFVHVNLNGWGMMERCRMVWWGRWVP